MEEGHVSILENCYWDHSGSAVWTNRLGKRFDERRDFVKYAATALL